MIGTYFNFYKRIEVKGLRNFFLLTMNRQTEDNCQRPRKTGRRCRLPCSGKKKTAQLLSDRNGLPLCSRNLKE